MALIHEKLSDQFYDWEIRGRGWNLYQESVRPEPAFRPFEGHFLKPEPQVDDGRRPTFLSSLFQTLTDGLNPKPPPEDEIADEEPEPNFFEHGDLIELRATLPAKINITRESCAEFLANLSHCQSPIAFEIIGSHDAVALQFTCAREDLQTVRQQLEAHFPDGAFIETERALEIAWSKSPFEEALVVEFGLAREFMFQLRTEKADPFVGIVGALSKLREGEISVFQVLFEPARANWKESIEFSVCHADGKPFFVNAADLAAAAKWKTMQQLYAAVVRVAVVSESFDRTLEIARGLGGALGVFSNPQGNELIPLKNDDYEFDAHIEDLLNRNSRRSGMLLTADELLGFVHLPSPAVRSPELLRETKRTKAAPALVREDGGVLLGENTHAGITVEVRLRAEERVRHMHVIGASGTGKSSLLLNLISDDIENGQGVAVLDPHGDLVDRILTIIPSERFDDVIVVDPSDEEFSIGFNILSAHSDLEKTLLASDLISVFQRLSASWGDQMGSVLQNAILAFLESSEGGTLADMRRFLIEPAFREKFLKTVRDPDIVYYWRKGFAQLSGNKSIGSVITRLETFLAPKPIRYMVSQKENRLDFARIMDSGKIFLAKLPQGKMGKENAFLLGSLFVSKFQQTAMSRQDRAVQNRRDFWLYVDEFHNFITPSMAEILSGARKYRLGLILAHQDLRQLDRDRDVGSAVLSNSFTRVIFRVGDADARNLAEGLSFFEASDLQNLETGQAICRVEKANGDFNLSVPYPESVPLEEAEERRKIVIAASRVRNGTPRSAIEAALNAKFENTYEENKAGSRKTIEAQEALHTTPKTEIPTVPTPSPSSFLTAVELSQEVPVLSESARDALERKGESPSIAEEKSPKAPREAGQGGSRHKIIQRRIKEAAEAAGFQATIEKQIPGTERRIDVFLERNDFTIACEVSFETTPDWEVGNVLKSINAGATLVAIICLDQVRLANIKKSVLGTFAPEDASRVQYFEPSQFIAHLKTLSVPQQTPKKRAGRVIRRSHSELSPEERKAREAESIRAIAEALNQKSK